MAQPNQPSVAQERFGRSSGRLTASQVIETCATILAGVILLGLAWTNPQPYAPVDLIAGLSGAAALIVGVRLPQVRPMLRSWPALWLALGGIILIVAAARYEASLKSMRTMPRVLAICGESRGRPEADYQRPAIAVLHTGQCPLPPYPADKRLAMIRYQSRSTSLARHSGFGQYVVSPSRSCTLPVYT